MNWKFYLLWPLRSRKVQVAVATLLAAWLAEVGLKVSDTVIASIVGIGVSLIAGIAIEDHGAKQALANQIDEDNTVTLIADGSREVGFRPMSVVDEDRDAAGGEIDA